MARSLRRRHGGMSDLWLQRRLADPRYAKLHTRLQYQFAVPPADSTPKADSKKDDEPKKKRRRKTTESGKSATASSSGSADESGKKKKKKRCWKGYSPVEGVKPYAPGSCAPTKKD